MKSFRFWCTVCIPLLLDGHKSNVAGQLNVPLDGLTGNTTESQSNTTANPLNKENGTDPLATCSICFDGNGVINMEDGSDSAAGSMVYNRLIFGSNRTCRQSLEAVKNSPTDQCATSIATLNAEMGMDVGRYCGCTHDNQLPTTSGITSSSCSFCHEGMPVVDMYLEVPTLPKLQNDLIDEKSDPMTCGDYAALAPFIFDQGLCQMLQDSFASFLCCPGGCSFCPQTEQLDASKRQREFISSNGTTCGALSDLVTFLPASDCSALVDSFNGTFDTAVYCGCPGVAAVGICAICDEESGYLKVDDPYNVQLNDANCGAYYDLADAAVSDDFCLDILSINDIQEICCYGPLTAAPTSPSSIPPSSADLAFVMKQPSSATRHMGRFVPIVTITLVGVHFLLNR